MSFASYMTYLPLACLDSDTVLLGRSHEVLSGIEDVIGVIHDILTFGVTRFTYRQSFQALKISLVSYKTY